MCTGRPTESLLPSGLVRLIVSVAYGSQIEVPMLFACKLHNLGSRCKFFGPKMSISFTHKLLFIHIDEST